MRRFLRAWLGTILAVTAAQGASLTLTPTRDNTLYESPTGALSNGSGQALFTGNTAGGGSAPGVAGL